MAEMAQPAGEPPGIVTVAAVSKRFGHTLALDGLSLDIGRGETFALLGPNGAGKSTLISIIATIQQADSGTVTVGGFDVARRPMKARQLLGVVFQESSLDTRLTVQENLEFHGRIHGVPRKELRARIDDLLDLVELTEARHRIVRGLSGGMKRRAEIARALVHDARILILDEPTVGLDAQTRERIWDYLDRIRAARDLTLIVTTHYIDEVDGCDRICILDHGKIIALDSPDALRTRHGRDTVRIRAADPAAFSAILAAHPGAKTRRNGEIAIEADPAEVEPLMSGLRARHGDRLAYLTLERPSLESAFLNLTGRELQGEQPAASAAGGRRA